MLIVIAAITLLTALAFLSVGLRGRRTDDHPLCRRCRYDLTGRSAEAVRCPECGADLARPRAIRIGHRQRRRGVLALGTVALAAGLAVAAMGGRDWARTVNWESHKPVWWLRRDLASTDPATQTAALAELTARVAAGRLSADVVADVADRALAAQANPALWSTAWGAFVEAAHAAGRLDRPRWATYGRQGVRVAFATRPVIRRGDPMPVSFHFDADHLATAGFGAFFDARGLTLDGHPVGKRHNWDLSEYGGHIGRFRVSPQGSMTGYAPPDLGKASGRLAVGPHALAGTLHVYLYDEADMPDRTADGRPGVPPPSRQIGEFDVPLSATVTVCDPAHEPPLTVVDPARRAAVAAAVQVRAVTVEGTTVTLETLLDNPPVRLAFTVALRPVGSGSAVKFHFHERALAGSGQGYIDSAEGSVGAAQQVDVTFTPDVSSVRDDVDPSPIWGEPVVVRGLPVTRVR